jgi:predicted metalloprotease
VGDFGIAYIIAHEYAHNVQEELGIRSRGVTVKLFELQADCLAGAWANSEYYAGLLEGGDYAEAVGTADLVGDYDFTDPEHHGTPAERAAAWKFGYDTGSGARCGERFSP